MKYITLSEEFVASVCRNKLSASAIKIMMHFLLAADEGGKCRLIKTHIARHCNITRQQVYNAIDELQSAQFIKLNGQFVCIEQTLNYYPNAPS